jgi:ribosomal-protein-alanine N-acetyltransferase
MIAFPWSPRIFVDAARSDEAETLSDVHATAFASTWSADEFAMLLANPGAFALALRRQAAFGGRRVAGFVLMRVAAAEAEVLTIAVRPEYRGRGYGRLLMEEALRRLYRDRVAACFLEVERSNAAAVSLYRSLGFVVAGERKRYYAAAAEAGGGDALVMRVQLR